MSEEAEDIEERGPGRPPIFDSPGQMSKAIDEFIHITPKKELTITGLAMYLGFESRQSFYDYEEKPEYSYIVKKARLAVENGYELSLRSQNVTGAIFALKNMGWKDKVEQEHTGKDGSPLQLTPPAITVINSGPPLSRTEEEIK